MCVCERVSRNTDGEAVTNMNSKTQWVNSMMLLSQGVDMVQCCTIELMDQLDTLSVGVRKMKKKLCELRRMSLET